MSTSSTSATTASATTGGHTDHAAADDLNLAIIRGRLAAEPDLRTLPSGGLVAQFDLITGEGTAPVAWHDPTPATAKMMRTGLSIVVIGRVHRRFFRTGGRTQSRTEVVADRVIPARRTATVRTAIDVVLADLIE